MPSLLHHLVAKRSLAWALALVALSLYLCGVPLLNRLGYEYCLVLALAVSFAGAHLGSMVVARTRAGRARQLAKTHSPLGIVAGLLGRAIALSWLLLLPALLVISLNALRVTNCNLAAGLALFALLPLTSAAIAAACGVLWGLVFERPWVATGAAMLCVLGMLLWGLLRFYAEPPINGYGPFAGYFAGSIYDENVGVRAPLLWARLQQLSWIVAFSALAALLTNPQTLRLGLRLSLSRLTAGLLALSTAGALLLSYHGAELGFAVDAAQIKRELGGRRFTEHFELIYPREWSAKRVAQAIEDHEFRYAQLHPLFGAGPRRIRSYTFRNSQEKRRLLGSGGVLIAKPWREEIYLEDDGFPARALKHELAHVFAGAFGDGLLNVSLAWRPGPLGLPLPHFSIGLIEGLAVAVDWRPQGEMDGHQRAAALGRLGLAPPLQPLFGLGFLTHAGSRSYALAGSFCRYLLEQHGMPRLLAAHRRAGEFAQVYGRPLDQLAGDWRAWLAKVPLPKAQLQLAEERFRRPGILKRKCPHEVAKLRQRAHQQRRSGQPEAASATLRQICQLEPGDPAHLVALMNAVALADGPGPALALRERLLGHPGLSRPLERRILERLGDLQWLQGAPQSARRNYAAAAQRAGNPGARRVLALKRLALDHSSEIRSALMRYLVEAPGVARNPTLELHLAQRLSRLLPQSGLGPYLVGKQLSSRGLCSEATAPLTEALNKGLPAADFTIEAYRTLGRCSYEIGHLEAAQRAFAQIDGRSDVQRGTRLEARDWLARIDHRAGQPAP